MFNDDQKKHLSEPLSRESVKGRKQGGRTVSYVEGWHVIAEANRIFGFDGWSSETLDLHVVSERGRPIGEAQKPGWGVTYAAKVRITAGGISREGTGTGQGIDLDIGQAHESAMKEAETDARKRALMTFGNPFGLALYDKEQANVADESEISRQRFIDQTKAKIEQLGANPPQLLTWWASDEQKKARRDFDLAPDEVAMLKNMVTARLPKEMAR